MSSSPTPPASGGSASASDRNTASSFSGERWSPISTLERQYAAPVGRRTTLVIRANAPCAVPGGVEAVLRALRHAGHKGAGGGGTPASPPDSGNSVDLLRFDSALSEEAAGGPVAETSPTAAEADDDPFGLSSGSQPQQHQHRSKFANLKSNLTRMAKTTQDHIAQGVTTIAIKAEGKSARKPDKVTVGVFVVQQGRHGHRAQEVCVGTTESKSAEEGSAVTFAVPVVLPPEGTLPPDTVLTLRLLIRSGAALLKSKALQKSFVVGEGTVRIGDVAGSLQKAKSSGGGVAAGAMSVSLRGPALEGQNLQAALEVLVLPDLKFPALCGPGWTLADPRTDVAYGGFTTGGRVFNYPLDQTYAYPQSPQQGGGAAAVVATERATESAVVLPLAAAVARVMADAATVSTAHAADVYSALKSNSMDFGDDAIQAIESGHAQCQVEVRGLVLYPTQSPGSPTSSANVELRLQRPVSVFEKALGRGTVPVQRSEPGNQVPPQLVNAAPSLSVPFYPLVCPENHPRLLPGVAAAQNSGARTTGGRAFVGTLRIEIREQIASNSGMVDGGNPFGVGAGRVPNLATAATLASDNPSYQVTSSNGVGMPPGGMSGGFVPSGSGGQRAMGPLLEGYIDIDPHLDADGETANVHVYDQKTGAAVGYLVASLHARTAGGVISGDGKVSPARGGLISMVGMDTLTEASGCHPVLEYDSDFPAALEGAADPMAAPGEDAKVAYLRRRQMSTMGDFIGHEYLKRHNQKVRSLDLKGLSERAERYRAALVANSTTSSGPPPSEEEPCKRKDPLPFRPSSSRMDALLCGIAFNVHVQSLALYRVGEGGGAATPLATFHNVTHGAPSDHFRGFGGGSSGTSHGAGGSASPAESASAVPTSLGHRGGLRRLEIERRNVAKQLRDAQSDLIHAVAVHFSELAGRQRTLQAAGVPPAAIGSNRHIPPDHPNIVKLRAAVRDKAQSLHALTWDVAVRRANCFSQALGIGVTSYLSHVSDATKLGPAGGARGGWADQVLQHGFLLTFEGLLSTAGKELGMIEDASVGIAMLRMVSIALVPDDGKQPGSAGRLLAPDCTYVRWVNLLPSGGGIGSEMRFRLEVGIDTNYHSQRVPAPLRDGAEVRFYPLLYQMGVDIRQWGANAGMNVKKQMTNNPSSQPPSRQSSNVSEVGGESEMSGSGDGLIDDEDDDVGVPDNDVLIALNLEAFRKMNAYAHAVIPASDAATFTGMVLTWEQAALQQISQPLSYNVGPVHPSLAKLYEFIRSSAGRMEHGVLEEASSLAAILGGGGAVFCKSGKDRTAMQVTYKAARYLRRYLATGCQSGDSTQSDGDVSTTGVLADATLMRIHGTRLPICEKNVGQAKFAFNSLQAKFMPDELKPPPSTLAGFLKGGRVFSREGGIES